MASVRSRLRGAGAAALLAACGLLAGCATVPTDALVLSPESMQLRQMQTRRIDGISEKDLLNASVGVLQDLGFEIDEAETKLGLVVASKDRSAFTPSQLAGALALALLGVQMPLDRTQKIRVSLVTHPALGQDGNPIPNSQVIRITIQRIVWNDQNQISRTEAIEEPVIYQQFFEKLSKSIFLEVQAT